MYNQTKRGDLMPYGMMIAQAETDTRPSMSLCIQHRYGKFNMHCKSERSVYSALDPSSQAEPRYWCLSFLCSKEICKKALPPWVLALLLWSFPNTVCTLVCLHRYLLVPLACNVNAINLFAVLVQCPLHLQRHAPALSGAGHDQYYSTFLRV